MSFITSSKKHYKNCRANLIKHMSSRVKEKQNYKTLPSKSKLGKWKKSSYEWFRKLSIFRIPVLLRGMYKFKKKNLIKPFCKNWQPESKMYMENKWPGIVKAILKQRRKLYHSLPYFKTYCMNMYVFNLKMPYS